MIKKLLKMMIPDVFFPTVVKVNRIISSLTDNSGFEKNQLDKQSVLNCGIAYNKYGGYCIPMQSRHRPAAYEVISGGIYEPETIKFITENCAGGDLVHAGTYFGDFLPALSMSCDKGQKIWAFEPNNENYRCAEITKLINNLSNVELLNAGLGEKEDQVELVTSDSQGKSLGGSSTILQSSEILTSELSEIVGIVTIDESIPLDRKISIIQLDVEGHEIAALKGSIKTIKRCLPIIILEVLPESDLISHSWFKNNILVLGYHVTQSLHGNVVLQCIS